MTHTDAPTLAHAGIVAEAIKGEHGPAIRLTQSDDLEFPSVALHPDQLRAVCLHFGLADDRHAAKTIAALQRRMTCLSERIADLAAWMAKFSDHKHADLSHEMHSINALNDLAHEWCQDFAPEALQSDAAVKAASLTEAPASSLQGALL